MQRRRGAFDDAIAFVRANPNRYVIKPSGEAQNLKGLLFVGEEEDGRDVIEVLEDYKRAWANQVQSFQLQRRVLGVEVATGAFFNGREFVYPICVNFEHKKLFPGDIGPSTGEMGTAMFWSEPNKIFNQTLRRMEPALAREGYVGYIDINCIVNANGVYPLEFTARFGYPTISIQQEGLLTPMGELLRGLAASDTPLRITELPKWVREKRPMSADLPQPLPQSFPCLPQPDISVDAATVDRYRLSPDYRLIDARPEQRFTGERDPLDTIAGHIPGSLNWVFEENLDMDGTFLPADELRANYLRLMEGVDSHNVIHTCGSGVTACHNLLAMEVAGLTGSRLYPGSWSEWITDPARPVATGDAVLAS